MQHSLLFCSLFFFGGGKCIKHICYISILPHLGPSVYYVCKTVILIPTCLYINFHAFAFSREPSPPRTQNRLNLITPPQCVCNIWMTPLMTELCFVVVFLIREVFFIRFSVLKISLSLFKTYCRACSLLSTVVNV